MGCVLGRPGSPGSVVSSRIESNRKEVNNVSVTKTETIQTTSVVVASASTSEEVRNDEAVVKNHKEENGTKERKPRGERRRSSKPDPRRSNPPKNLLGEQVAAGWPPWLSEVCGEALNGWLPRKADSFEKIEKVKIKKTLFLCSVLWVVKVCCFVCRTEKTLFLCSVLWHDVGLLKSVALF